jgi:formamidopyrimidine-DNA glycosylase
VPELPEVETVVRDLRPRLVGRRIASVEVGRLPLRRRWAAAWGPGLIGRRIRDVWRRGKWLVVELDKGLHLVFHLGMTGQLTVVAARESYQPHTHLVFGLDRGGRQLRFRDVRRFGSATLFGSRQAMDDFFRDAGLGPEPFALDSSYWRWRLASTNRCLKAVLLDQRVVAGVGNIYANESLFEARLHPARSARETSPREAERLRQAIVTVLNRAIEKRGSSIRNYVGGAGRKGRYQDEFRAYGRTGEPCLRCGRPISCIRVAGRSTHFCPKCQTLKPFSREPRARAAPRSPEARG